MAESFTTRVAQDTGIAALKLSPPITVWALTLNEWLTVAALIYTALQAFYLAWKWQLEWRRGKQAPP